MSKKETKDEAPEASPEASKEGSAQSGQVETLSAELAECKKQHLYLRADFDNYRKQAIKERSDLIKFGAEPVLREFLSVLDNFDRAAHAPVTAETLEAYKNGLELIITQFKKTLERFGVEEVPCAGLPFDPLIHEALGKSQNPEVAPNTITEVFRKAYKLHGKVIRAAQVVVNEESK